MFRYLQTRRNFGLIGGSGVGKSTCLRVMTGQQKPTKGYAVLRDAMPLKTKEN